MTRRSGVWGLLVAFATGIVLGGYVFSASQPRSLLALVPCDHCYSPNELAGLLASAGIQRIGGALPLVVKESDRCLAIRHPLPAARVHLVVFPKKDVKDIADVAVEDQPYVLDCLAIVRALVLEYGLRQYRVVTNGPGLQAVRYLHLHVLGR